MKKIFMFFIMILSLFTFTSCDELDGFVPKPNNPSEKPNVEFPDRPNTEIPSDKPNVEQPDTNKPSGPKKITIYTSFGNLLNQTFDEVAAKYNETNDDYDIVIMHCNPNDFYNTVKNQNGINHGGYIGKYAGTTKLLYNEDNRYVLDLNERFIKNDPEFQTLAINNYLYNELLKSNDNKHIELPFLYSTNILYVNKELLAQANVDLKELETWNDILKPGGVLDKIEQSNVSKYSLGFDYTNHYVNSYCRSKGIEVIKHGNTMADRIGLANDAVIESVYNELSRFSNHKVVTANTLGFYISTAFNDNELPLAVSSSAGVSHFNYDPNTMAILPYPKYDNGSYNEAFMFNVGMFNLKDRKAEEFVWGFIKELYSDDTLIQLLDKSAFSVASHKVSETPSINNILLKHRGKIQVFEVVNGSLDSLYVTANVEKCYLINDMVDVLSHNQLTKPQSLEEFRNTVYDSIKNLVI